MTNNHISLVEYDSIWLSELLAMWRESFEFGVGIKDPHPLADQERYFHNEVLPNYSVRLAMRDGNLVGFIAGSKESIAQLYIRVGCHRLGIGSLLLDWAKAQSSGSLWLYTSNAIKSHEASMKIMGLSQSNLALKSSGNLRM